MPTNSALSRATGAGPCCLAHVRTTDLSRSSHTYLITEFGQRLASDAFDLHQLIHIVETTELHAVIKYALRGNRTDSLQRLQFLQACGIEVKKVGSGIGIGRFGSCRIRLCG